ncbi:hypothetical protein PoB_005624500 [Plakobranchus ocellatus]|uniref:ATP synthase F0 subunit 8 n=1 Tax=Plakobranchus ocellatus TaxID=259542 RepID=A0AAV4CAK0_9GAST|nr:hypothetical protein PoB_005624500 [Plakobranchus ocellatus]
MLSLCLEEKCSNVFLSPSLGNQVMAGSDFAWQQDNCFPSTRFTPFAPSSWLFAALFSGLYLLLLLLLFIMKGTLFKDWPVVERLGEDKPPSFKPSERKEETTQAQETQAQETQAQDTQAQVTIPYRVGSSSV